MALVTDDDTLQMYIEESKEHLESIEGDLLTIEQQGKDIDEDLVNKVFRAAHSIKGGAGFLGLDAIKELAHRIENLLDLIRNFQMVPTTEIINTILAAFDHLGTLLAHARESNDMAIADHVEALNALAAASLNSEEKAQMEQPAEIGVPDLATVFTLTEFEVQQARKGGKNLYILEYDLLRDVQRQGMNPLDLMRALDDAGTVLDMKIDIGRVDDLDSEVITSTIPLFVLYASVIEPDLMNRIVGVEEEGIYLVPRQPAGSPLPPPVVTPPAAEPEPTPPPLAAAPREAESRPAPPVNKKAGKAGSEAAGEPGAGAGQHDSLRVSVSLLDELMNRAGELVLARNQLLQSLSQGDRQSIKVAGQRIDLVTSELQETIMLTRMQPVGNIFNKFPRVVRDLAVKLGKEMDLVLEGKEVELDKTIIEGLGDPLTHLVRNSADHGIELPAERLAKGKPASGHIVLRAFYESGQVQIEIEDDGKGLDPDLLADKALRKGLISEQQLEGMSDKEKIGLIMLPGFSTAEKVTEVSGRGVGMDVVKTNLDKLGGQVEILSVVDRGTTIRIKLPLTLAIIPSLLVASCGERFALPQVNIGELLRVPAAEIRDKISKVGEADVLNLRGDLIPLLQLNNVMRLSSTYYDARTGVIRPDRRQKLADERLSGEAVPVDEAAAEASPEERRQRPASDISIVVLSTGSFKYGMVVDQVYDTIEIVIKPLGRHLKNCEIYAGATIMGDGKVALILDVAGLAQHANLRALGDTAQKAMAERARQARADKDQATRQSLLMFRNGPEEQCAIPLSYILRIERIKASSIELKGGRKVIQYRGGFLPVYALEEVAAVEMLEEREDVNVILFDVQGRELGLLAMPPLDVVDVDLVIDEQTLRQTGIGGSAIINGRTTLLVDVVEFVKGLHPEWFAEGEPMTAQPGASVAPAGRAVLLVEDSSFFRNQLKRFVEEAGYAVIESEDGLQALTVLDERLAEIGMVVTDIEMPNLDGYALASRIKGEPRFARLPIVALSSLASDEDIARGRAAGIDEYQVKLDRDNLVLALQRFMTA